MLNIVMTVAYVDQTWGGHEVFLSQALARRGHQITLLTSNIAPPRYGKRRYSTDANLAGVKVTHFSSGPMAFEAPLIPGMLRHLLSSPADVYHAHETFQPATLWTALAARKFHRPLLVTQHTAGVFGSRFAGHFYHAHLSLWGKRILAQAAGVITLTTQGKRGLNGVVPADRVRVIPSGVDLSLFTALGPTSALLAGLQKPLILFAGRFAPNKDLGTLLDAFSRLGRGTLALVGSGPEEPSIRKVAADLLREGRLVMLKPMPNDQMPELYRAADLFVLPSVNEPFGLVLLEAMACGCPAIAADAEGPSSILPERLVCPRGNSLAMARAMEAALANREYEREQAIALAREYSWDRVAENVESLYYASLQSKQTPLAYQQRAALREQQR